MEHNYFEEDEGLLKRMEQEAEYDALFPGIAPEVRERLILINCLQDILAGKQFVSPMITLYANKHFPMVHFKDDRIKAAVQDLLKKAAKLVVEDFDG